MAAGGACAAVQGMRRIGVLMTVNEADPEGQARIDALRQGLNQLGRSEGKNLAIEYRWAGGDIARLRECAAELIGLASVGPTRLHYLILISRIGHAAT
jgi:putative ABC transport system substrate-binding protein